MGMAGSHRFSASALGSGLLLFCLAFATGTAAAQPAVAAATSISAESDAGPAPIDERPDAAWDSREEPAVRLTFMPMLGSVGGMPGVGGEFGMGYKALAWGIRASGGSEFCIFCSEPEKESQISFLLGVRDEFEIGVLSFKSGLTRIERTRRGQRIEDGGETGFFSTTEYEMHTHEGLGVPLQFDLILGGRFVGVDFSMTYLHDGEGGSTSILIGIPFGYLRH
jgi:hypothetical protein